MEIKKSVQSLMRKIVKYKHAVLIVAIGMLLMTVPTFGKKDTQEAPKDAQSVVVPTMEAQLSAILSQVHGAGEVQVMLSIAQGEQVLYQTNIDKTGAAENQRQTTVTVSDGSRNETGLIRQVIPAQYQGAVVICSGANDPAVRLAVVDAVSKLTGLGANHISVLKMK